LVSAVLETWVPLSGVQCNSDMTRLARWMNFLFMVPFIADLY